MGHERGSHSFAFFLLGLGIGAVAALVLAPQEGEKTRKLIAEKAEEGKEFLADKRKELRRQAEDFVNRSRYLINVGRDRFAGAIQAGRQAYNSTVGR